MGGGTDRENVKRESRVKGLTHRLQALHGRRLTYGETGKEKSKSATKLTMKENHCVIAGPQAATRWQCFTPGEVERYVK